MPARRTASAVRRSWQRGFTADEDGYWTTRLRVKGSEYPVVIPVKTQHYAMLQRNLLYTGVTRGRQLVVLVGQPKAVAIAVKNECGRKRWSKLREWLASVAERG